MQPVTPQAPGSFLEHPSSGWTAAAQGSSWPAPVVARSGIPSPSFALPESFALSDAPPRRGEPLLLQFRPQILPLGDTALTVDFGDAIDPVRNSAVLALEQAVAAVELPGVLEAVPSYRALMILYNPAEIGFGQLAARLHELLGYAGAASAGLRTSWTVPVAYDPPFGLDHPELAEALGLAPERICALHAASQYSVYMVGFAPGFTYLGGLDPALTVPRRATPRPQVPDGSIMIGGKQAAIVSVPIPTGWYVLGRTPLRAFDPQRADPFLFRPGDQVRFRPVSPAEFDRLAGLPAAELCELAREEAPCRAS